MLSAIFAMMTILKYGIGVRCKELYISFVLGIEEACDTVCEMVCFLQFDSSVMFHPNLRELEAENDIGRMICDKGLLFKRGR